MRNWDPLHTFRRYKRIKKSGLLHAGPPVVLAGGFLVLIALGTLLLKLPFATHHPISYFSAFFTATSAVTVTGLSIVDIGTTFTHFGQIVLALLVQIGGLGFVTFAVVAALTLGKKISLSQQAVVLEAFNQTSVSRIQHTAWAVFKISAAIEITSVIILTLWWWPDHASISTALYRAAFHSVMAFNNAGFSLEASNLTRFVADPVTIMATTFLIILGGIGFGVLNDVGQKRAWTRLAPYTKVILLATLALNLIGFVFIWLLEFNNPDTLGALSTHGQALAAWLQSVTARTAGFTSIDITKLNDSTTLMMIFLMFIGGGSLSTASGIKVGTLIVLIAATYSYVRQRSDVVLLQRSVSSDTVQKALALVLVTATLALASIFLMSIFEHRAFIDIVFEVVSALSTTGLSRDLTPHLSTPSQILVIILMFVGRLGPLTLIYSLSTQRRSRIRYPEGQFQVG